MSLCAVDPKKYCQCQPDEGLLCVNRVPAGYKLLKDSTLVERCWDEGLNGVDTSYRDCTVCLRKFAAPINQATCKICHQESSNV